MSHQVILHHKAMEDIVVLIEESTKIDTCKFPPSLFQVCTVKHANNLPLELKAKKS